MSPSLYYESKSIPLLKVLLYTIFQVYTMSPSQHQEYKFIPHYNVLEEIQFHNGRNLISHQTNHIPNQN